MYLIIGEVDGYIKEKNGNKYLVFAFTDKTKEVLKKYTELWDGIKNLIKKINDIPGEYKKNLWRSYLIQMNLLLNKILKLHNLTIVVRSVFEDDKYYPQFF